MSENNNHFFSSHVEAAPITNCQLPRGPRVEGQNSGAEPYTPQAKTDHLPLPEALTDSITNVSLGARYDVLRLTAAQSFYAYSSSWRYS